MLVRRIAGISCVFALAVVGSAAAAEPDWLQTLRAREAKPAATKDVRSQDGWFRAKVPARQINKTEAAGDSYSMSFELEPESQVHCELIREGFDPAALLARTAAISFESLATEQGKIKQRAVERSDAGHFNGSPYLAIDWLYRVQTPEGAKVGSLKQIAALKDGHGVYCVHNVVGYSKSFEAVVRALVETLQVKDAPAPGLYDEVSVVSLGGTKVGVIATTIARDGETALRVQNTSSMLVAITPESLRAQDDVVLEFVRQDGSLINAVHVEAADGTVDSQLELKPVEAGGWQVSGTFKGKTLDGKLAAAPAPSTFLLQAISRKALLARADPAGGEIVEWAWVSADPLRLTESRVKVGGPAGPGLYNAHESIGAIQATTVLDAATGMTQRAEIALGPLTMTIERVYVRGQL